MRRYGSSSCIRGEEAGGDMPYYVLKRFGKALYSMHMLLSEDEVRWYGKKGNMAPVKALYVWTNVGALEAFQQFLSVEQHTRHAPFFGLIKDMRADRVKVLELSTNQAWEHLRRYRRVRFVCINPGPSQKVRQTEEFLAELEE
jgi:hypothetical protein